MEIQTDPKEPKYKSVGDYPYDLENRDLREIFAPYPLDGENNQQVQIIQNTEEEDNEGQ